MRRIKSYRIWEKEGNLTSVQIDFLNRYVTGSWTMNPEGFVDVEGDFDCSSKKIVSLNGIRFGSVGGNFYCHNNQLTSLEGAPREVRGDFYCHRNQLTSLEGAPREVGRDFYCHENPISDQTIELICQKMRENPDLGYGAILASLQSRIPEKDWDKLDKSSMEGITDRAKRGYKLLGGIGGI